MPEETVRLSAQNYPWFLRLRNLTHVIIAAFFLVCVVAFFLCYEHYRSAKGHALKEDRAAASLISLILEEHFQRIIKTMESYANRPLLLQAVKGRNGDKALEHLRSLVESSPGMDSAIIADRQGTVWTRYPPGPEVIGRNFAYQDWYKGVSKEWKPYVSDSYAMVIGQKDIAIRTCVPFFDETGAAIGILGILQRTVEMSAIIGRVPFDAGSSVSVTDRKGNLAYSSRFAHNKQITPYPFYSVIHEDKAGKDQSVVVEDALPAGGKRYVSFAPVAGMGWHVFVSRSNRAILLSEVPYYVQVASTALLLFIIIILGLLYFRKRVTTQQVAGQLRAQEEIRKERDQAQLYLDIAAVMIVALDTRGSILLINKKGCGILGYREEELVGRNWFDLCLPEAMRQEVQGVFNQLIAGEVPPVEYYENTVLTRDGTERIIAFRNALLRNPSSRIIGTLSSGEDVTERKRAEAALRASEERLRLTLDATNDGVWDWDVPSGSAVFSPRWYTMLGYEPYEFPQNYASWRSLVHPDDIDGAEREIEKHISSGTGYAIEIRMRTKSGQWRWILARGRVVGRNVEGRVLRLVGTHTDIEDRKRAEEEIITLNRELEQRVLERTAELSAVNKELEAFSYSVSHDLRAPLRSIDGFSQALLEDCGDKLDEAGKDYLGRVRRASQHMGRLIDDLLRLSRVSRAQMSRESVDMTAMAWSVADEMAGLNGGREVDLAIAPDITAKGDPGLLRIVLENLFGNAYKFTRGVEPTEIVFGCSAERGNTLYFVRDNGVGFDMKFADKLFNPFQRLHAARDFEGTGIGLATVQRIIQKHGGKVWTESEPGKGTTVYFTL